MTNQNDLFVLSPEEALARVPPPTGAPVTGVVGRVIGDATLALLGGVVGRLLLYAAQFVLARWLGPVDFGLFSLSLSVTQLVSVIAGFGLYMAVVRFTAIYAGENSTGRAWNLLISAGRVVAGSHALAALTMIAWPSAWAGVLREAGLARVLPLMGAALPALTLTRLVASSLTAWAGRACGRWLRARLPRSFSWPASSRVQVSQRLDLRPRPALTCCRGWRRLAPAGGSSSGGCACPAAEGAHRPGSDRQVRPSSLGVGRLEPVSQRLNILFASFLLRRRRPGGLFGSFAGHGGHELSDDDL